MLKDLEAERNLYEMRQYLPLKHDIFEEDDRKDILEHWNEDKLDKWKSKYLYHILLNIFLFIISAAKIKIYLIVVQHRQREKEYRQKLAQLREKEKTNICTEEDLFKKLDELELEEELRDEIYRLF